jgi:hypothetical protein
MPLGAEPLGLAYFAAIKFAGYSAAAVLLNRKAPRPSHSAWLVGGARTAIGLATGFVAILLAGWLNTGPSRFAFYPLLAPIRILEWLFLLALFYRGQAWSRRRGFGYSLLGTLWSYVLDVPAVLSMFVLPHGAWIC